jgi:hypothetical protein
MVGADPPPPDVVVVVLVLVLVLVVVEVPVLVPVEPPLQVEASQYWATSLTHWAFHSVWQQYASCAQTAAVHASHESLRACV